MAKVALTGPGTRTTIKVNETSTNIAHGSALDKYWKNNGFNSMLHKIRPGAPKEETLKALQTFDNITNEFSLKGIGYGNWVNQEDRFNYSLALYFSLFDLQRCLEFKNNNLGLYGSLGITFGARGIPGALAHYEPLENIINISRYANDPSVDKTERFIRTGGMGSFAHEYGHFLDYWFGRYAENYNALSISLTDGSSIASVNYTNIYNMSKYPFRYQMARVMQSIIFSDPAKGKLSMYYKLLENKLDKKNDAYYFRHNELFARAFEVYIFSECNKRGINNRFLSDYKYDGKLYLSPKEFARVKPEMDRLMQLMRNRLK